jgi:two-component system sensor histidine kinase EvgS
MKKYLMILLFASFSNYLSSSERNIDSLFLVAEDVRADTTSRLKAYEQLSLHFLNAKEYDSCRMISMQGIELSNQTGGSRQLCTFESSIGTSYYYVGDTDKAMNWYIKSYESSLKFNPPRVIAEKLNYLGILSKTLGEQEKALKYYKQSLDYYGREEDQSDAIKAQIAYIQMNIGSLYLTNKEYDTALEYYNSCLPVIEESKNPRALSNIYNNFAAVYLHQQDYQRSLENYLKALTLSSPNSIGTGHAVLLANIAENYIFLDQFNKAKPYLEEAMEITRENDFLSVEQNIYSIYSDYYFDKGDFENAYIFRAKYEAIKDSIFNRQKSQDIAEIEIRYETEKKEQKNQALTIENERQARINRLLLIIQIIILISIIIILYIWSRVRRANTKLKIKQQELEKLNEQLKKSNNETAEALEFKSQFLANMSHEIRTPLNIIIGFAGILRKNIMESKLLKYIESIELSSENLLKLLNDILDMSKIEARKMLLKPEVVDLKKLIEEIHSLFILKAEEKNIKFTISIDENVPTAMMLDEIRTRQVLVNLIGNAIKFTNEGYVNVKVYCPEGNKAHNHQPSKTDLFIDVEDSGYGIPPEHHEVIFESFRQIQVKNQLKISGTGLGLPISRRLMELTGGTLNLKSEPGKGSVFTMYFKDIPVTSLNADAKIEDHPMSHLLDIQFHACRLLIADDEIMNRSLISSSFIGTEVIVFQAENGKEAVEMARKTLPDVILMDFNMPVMDGFAAAEKIKQNPETKKIPILAFSASSLITDLTGEEKELFSGFISKPVFITDLFEELSTFLPHTRKKSVEGELLGNKDFMSAVASDQLGLNKNVFSELDLKFSDRFSEVKKSNSMNLTLQFAEDLKAFALKNDFKSIELYSKKVIEACKNFNIDKVKQLLEKFPSILSQFKN